MPPLQTSRPERAPCEILNPDCIIRPGCFSKWLITAQRGVGIQYVTYSVQRRAVQNPVVGPRNWLWYLCHFSIGKFAPGSLAPRTPAPETPQSRPPSRDHCRILRHRPVGPAASRRARRHSGRPLRQGRGEGGFQPERGSATAGRAWRRSRDSPRPPGRNPGHGRSAPPAWSDRRRGGDAEGADPPLLLQRQALADIAYQQVDMPAEQRLGRRDAVGEGDMDHGRGAGAGLQCRASKASHWRCGRRRRRRCCR